MKSCCVSSDACEAGPGGSDTTFGWQSVGQELRPDDVTPDVTPFQHGNRALASKDMRKLQGKLSGMRSQMWLLLSAGAELLLQELMNIYVCIYMRVRVCSCAAERCARAEKC